MSRSVHRPANPSRVRVAARDRARSERRCRYFVRPAVSNARLALTEDGRIRLELKTRYGDGTTHFIFDPMTFLARLAALVPPPRAHVVVYHGVLASAASVRRHIVPSGAPESGPSEQPGLESGSCIPTRTRNFTWAELMKRVFLIDVLRCPCGGSRRLIAIITTADAILPILRCLGLAESAGPRGPPVSRSTTPDPEITSESTETRLVIE